MKEKGKAIKNINKRGHLFNLSLIFLLYSFSFGEKASSIKFKFLSSNFEFNFFKNLPSFLIKILILKSASNLMIIFGKF